MELRDYLSIVRKRWASILAAVVLVTAAAVGGTLLLTPVYESRSQVFVSVRTGGATSADLVQGSNFAQRQVKSYSDLVTSPRVLQPVIDELGLTETADELARSVTASSPLDTQLINIAVRHASPQQAAAIADAVAVSLAQEVADLERPEPGAPSPIQISTVRPAPVPEAPASPSMTRNVALGVLLGLGLGFGLALLRDVLDTRLRNEAHVSAVTHAAVIATIGYDDHASTDRLIVHSTPRSHVAESFRRLRTNLQFLDAADHPRALVVTSSLPGEGKSTTALNLALTLADSGARVVLVDADLRRPSVAEYMGLEGSAGLTTVLIGRAELQDVIQPWGQDHLHVLAAGQIPPNPSELLGSQAMANLLADLGHQYDHIVIDTPPLLPVTDATILAKLCGGALVVAGADKVHRNQLQEAVGSLETVGARVLGVVLNKVARRPSETYAYEAHPSEPVSPRRSARRGKRSGGADPAVSPSTLGSPAPAVDELFGAETHVGNSHWPGAPLGTQQPTRRHSRT